MSPFPFSSSVKLFFFVLHFSISCAIPSPSSLHSTNYLSSPYFHPSIQFPGSSHPSHTYRPKIWDSLKKTNTSIGFADSYPNKHYVLQVNGTADDSITLTLFLEPDLGPSNYTFVILSNDSRILRADEDISYTKTESPTTINTTIALDFNLFPGQVQLEVEARRTADFSLFAVYHVDFLVAGIAVYVNETDTLISGADRYFEIPSYENIHDKSHWEFSVFVQYVNGTTSDQLPPTQPSINSTHNVPPSSSSVYFDSIVPTFMFYSGQILWDNSICSINGGTWTGKNKMQLKPGCGMGFSPAYLNGTTYDGYRCAYDFQPNRAGKIGVLFSWDDLTFESELESEQFTNYVIIDIGGQPPSIIRRIEPANPFDKNGGEELYVEFINTADVNIASFNVNGIPFDIIPGSRTIVNGPDDFYETAKFTTKPGTGKRLPWTVTATRTSANGTVVPIQFIDETNFLFSYNDDNIVLSKITPSVIGEDGDVRMTLFGEFPSFNVNYLTHNVYIGNILIEKERYVSYTDSEIILLVPPRSYIGVSWRYAIYVQIDESFSNELFVEFYAMSIELRGIVFGASYDGDSDTYTLNYCGITTFMVTIIGQQEAKDVTYEWKLLDESNIDYLSSHNESSVVKNTSTLELPNDLIPRFNEMLYVTGSVSFQNMTRKFVFNVMKSQHVVIGVTLIQPENRTISIPMVNMRIIAKIELPQCAESPDELLYEWELENKSRTMEAASRMGHLPLSVHDQSLPPMYDKYIFSYVNDSGTFDDEITPTRLGRELIVPLEMVTHGIHRVQLTVKDKNANTTDMIISGKDRTTYTIYDSPLIAMIGTGELSRRVSDAEILIMSAQGSYDPDLVTSSDKSIGLHYQWSCGFSKFANMSNMVPCITDSLPNPSNNDTAKFEITARTLQAMSNETIEGSQGNVYFRYHVAVTKGGRLGTAAQDLTLARSDGVLVSRYHRIEIVNSRDEVVNMNAIDFWDDVVIRPVAPASTEWRFRLGFPTWERSRFLTRAGNLISSAGYYTVSETVPGFQQMPLGINADRLDPKQTYQFLISFQEVGRLADDVMVRLKTVEVPDLVFPDIVQANGSISKTFRATASTSFQAHAKFTYQFYLIDLGRVSSEYCVDGCTGAHTIRFQVPKAGLYILQCRLLAANGKRLLSVKNNTKIITVYSPSSSSSSMLSSALMSSRVASRETKESFSQQNDMMMRDFKLGDDGWVIQRGFYASESLYETGDQIVAMSGSETFDLCVNYTSKWVDFPLHIVTNELPNTPNTRNYISLATNFVRLSCMEGEESLLKLVNIVDRSISKTPQEEVLTTTTNPHSKDLPNVEVQEELRRFYNFSIAKAMQITTRGSSRNRLLSQPGMVHNLILDVAELSVKHLTTAATSGRVCGWKKEYTLSTRDGIPDGLASIPSLSRLEGARDRVETSSRQAQVAAKTEVGVTSVHVAVMCNPEQGMSLTTPHASFEWCDAVYAVSGNSRKIVTLAETYDYPYLSRVQGENASETERIVLVDISTRGKLNQLESAVSHESLVAAQAIELAHSGSTGTGAQTCYKVGMKMSPTLNQSALNQMATCWVNTPFRMAPRKPYGYRISSPFEADMYLRRKAGVSPTDDTRRSSVSIIAQTNDLGLYGAYRARCDGGIEGNLRPIHRMILVGFLIGILLLIIIITGLTYLLIYAVVGAATSAYDEEMYAAADDSYVERDYFGRKEVVMNVCSMSGSSRASFSAFLDPSLDPSKKPMLSGGVGVPEMASGSGKSKFFQLSEAGGVRHTINEDRVGSA